MTSKSQISQILGVLGVAYRRQAMTTEQIKLAVPVWHELLGDLDFGLLKTAVQQHCSNSQWFPSVAELRQAAFDLLETKAERITPGEAWAEVKRAISTGRHHFASGEATWSSPLVEKAFRAIGGWSYFCYALTSAEMSDRARFMQAIEDLRVRDRQERRMLPEIRAYRDRQRLAAQAEKEAGSGRLTDSTNDDEIQECADPTAADQIQDLANQLRPPASPKNGRPVQR